MEASINISRRFKGISKASHPDSLPKGNLFCFFKAERAATTY
jgi:hypothetical protein